MQSVLLALTAADPGADHAEASQNPQRFPSGLVLSGEFSEVHVASDRSQPERPTSVGSIETCDATAPSFVKSRTTPSDPHRLRVRHSIC